MLTFDKLSAVKIGDDYYLLAKNLGTTQALGSGADLKKLTEDQLQSSNTTPVFQIYFKALHDLGELHGWDWEAMCRPTEG
jgi:hypothetical protein